MRTERVNPHVLSVRVNEGPTQAADRKHLAYLLDKQTVAVLDLVTGQEFKHVYFNDLCLLTILPEFME